MLDLLQWPAFAVTVLAGWLVASDARGRRHAGFALFLLSNALWAAWGWHDGAWALIALQVALLVTNVRGVADNRQEQPPEAPPEEDLEPSSWSQRSDAEYAALVRDGLSPERREPEAPHETGERPVSGTSKPSDEPTGGRRAA